MAATGSDGVVILPFVGRAPGAPHSDSLAPAAERYFKEGWAERDYRVKAAPLIRTRKAVIDADFMTDDEYDNEFFKFMGDFRLKFCALVAFKVKNQKLCCTFHRSKDKDRFCAQDARILSGLSDRFALASSVSHAVSDAKAAGLSEAFDHMKLGALFFNRAGQVVRMNEVAERLMGEELNVSRGEIRAGTADETNALRRQVRSAISGLETPLKFNSIPIKRDGKQPLVIRIQKIDGFLRDYFSDIKVMAIIDDLEDDTAEKSTLVQSVFGLTPTEAAVAILLAQGESLKNVADQRQISYETARTHMKALFMKMGARRQSEIVSLITKLR